MKLLVNTTNGTQEVITVGQGGGYFDTSLVIWDEREDGLLPAITLGGMVRVDNELVLDAALLAQTQSDSLVIAKAAKNAQINTWRSDANQSTFNHSGKMIACDALSRSDIDAVAGSIALNAAFPAGFPNAWKATDNTYLSLPDIASFKAMYNSMTLQGTINFEHSQTLKTTLASATTVDQINAIVWQL